MSAGILMHHHSDAGLVVLLVHSGGPFWRNRDLESWSIPKGELEDGEDPEAAARRELAEELGIEATGSLQPLLPGRPAAPSTFPKSIARRGSRFPSLGRRFLQDRRRSRFATFSGCP
jgi:8-oxo-dGTP pyrophosphatase MutT (NUDIX family)